MGFQFLRTINISYNGKETITMKNYHKNKKALYFRKQKLIGILTIVLSILAVFLIKEDSVVILLFTIPLGFSLLFSKEPIWMDDYFWESKQNDKES